MGPKRSKWLQMAPSCTKLVPIGPNWSTLVQIGLTWSKWVQMSIKRPKMSQNVLYRPKMSQNVPKHPKTSHNVQKRQDSQTDHSHSHQQPHHYPHPLRIGPYNKFIIKIIQYILIDKCSIIFPLTKQKIMPIRIILTTPIFILITLTQPVTNILVEWIAIAFQ